MISDHREFNRLLNWLPCPYKLQGRWTFDDTSGNAWPVFFKTKSEAFAMGIRHKECALDRLGPSSELASQDSLTE